MVKVRKAALNRRRRRVCKLLSIIKEAAEKLKRKEISFKEFKRSLKVQSKADSSKKHFSYYRSWLTVVAATRKHFEKNGSFDNALDEEIAAVQRKIDRNFCTNFDSRNSSNISTTSAESEEDPEENVVLDLLDEHAAVNMPPTENPRDNDFDDREEAQVVANTVLPSSDALTAFKALIDLQKGYQANFKELVRVFENHKWIS